MVVNSQTKDDILKINTSHTALEIQNLQIGYNQKVVAKDINFKTHYGALVGIVGVNGVGKSTLLKTIANLQDAIKGNILLKGVPFENYNAVQLAQEISIVLTETVAFKNLTVYELIALGRQPYTNWIGTLTEKDKSKVSDIITLLQLEQLTAQKCFMLSDGQLQRVMIARALAQDTAIILLDEPTTHLDLYHKVQILKLLKKITQETNKTILYTSHEIEMSLQLCDQLLLLKDTNSPFGKPQELIDQGVFNTLFPNDMVTFNPDTKTFNITK